MIKKTLLRSIILLSFTLLLVNCGKDDDSPDSLANTFLERFDNTTWVGEGDYLENTTVYLRFHNNIVSPEEYWFSGLGYDTDCYINELRASYSPVEVIENSRNTLILKFTDDGNSATYKAVGETIEVVSFSSSLIEYTLRKTSNTLVDGLTICD